MLVEMREGTARSISVAAVYDRRSTPVGGHRPPLQEMRGAAGFTLLEVMISLAIFALAAVVLGSAYVNILNGYEAAARGMQSNEDFEFARQIVLTEPDRAKLEEGGDFETSGGTQVKWSVEITSTNIADLFNVAFTCEVGDRRSTENFTVLRPTWSVDQAERQQLKEEARTRILELQGKKE